MISVFFFFFPFLIVLFGVFLDGFLSLGVKTDAHMP